ncbi:MAG: hypothetical protein ACREAC_15740, partial [Blastocatellia bacterium]
MINPLPWISSERIRTKPLRRRFGPVLIASGEPDATDVKLCLHSDRNLVKLVVEYVEFGVLDRT